MQSPALVQNWQFPSKDGNSLNVSWERYDSYHAAPQVNFTARERYALIFDLLDVLYPQYYADMELA